MLLSFCTAAWQLSYPLYQWGKNSVHDVADKLLFAMMYTAAIYNKQFSRWTILYNNIYKNKKKTARESIHIHTLFVLCFLWKNKIQKNRRKICEAIFIIYLLIWVILCNCNIIFFFIPFSFFISEHVYAYARKCIYYVIIYTISTYNVVIYEKYILSFTHMGYLWLSWVI